MTTSGTVATTTIDTAKLLEHAVRRCGLDTAAQTPELVLAAKESLYVLLLSLANRGLNLWCIEKQLIPCTNGQVVYVSNAGTIDILNVLNSIPTRVTGTDTNTATSFTTQLTSSTQVVRVGVKFSSITAAETITFAHSTNGISWTTDLVKTKTDWATGTMYWFDLPILATDVYFRVSAVAGITVSDFYLATTVSDNPLTQWSRDTWTAQTNKYSQGTPVCYYMEKLLTPQVTLWPIPDNNYSHLSMFVHRQVQDMGTLTQTIEIPSRWLEGIIWQVALRIGFETPKIDPNRLTLLEKMAGEYLLEAEGNESDGAPIYLQPNIGVYTR